MEDYSNSLGLALTPRGRLTLVREPGSFVDRAVIESFERGTGHGLLFLGGAECAAAKLPIAYGYFRDFALRYISAVRTEGSAGIATPAVDVLERIAVAAPPMRGSEYLNTEVLAQLWRELDEALRTEWAEAKCGLAEFLQRRDPAWSLVGRVHFHLAENRRDPEVPFAFLATYTTSLSSQAKAQHLPLGQALTEYAGSAKKSSLLSLLVPVQRASETCPWLKSMVDAGEIYHPLRWTPAEALQLLRDVPQLEKAGVVVRMPASWNGNRPSRPRATAVVGGKSPVGIGQEALLDFHVDVTVDGEPLTAAEIKELLSKTDGLALVRGAWIELDRERLSAMLDRFRDAERAVKETGLGFAEAMRMLSGAGVSSRDAVEGANDVDWASVVAGDWLADTLKGLRSPQGLAEVTVGDALRATLRPYQQVGVRWLYLLSKLGLGACLADDMGLGKTIQVLSLLTVLQREPSPKPSILVAPASLLGNWASEIERFTPGLKALIAHPSAMPAADLKSLEQPERLVGVDLIITSYGALLRMPWLAERSWRLAILDEAQAIKNSNSLQTRAVKKLKAQARLAMTGTPVENRLGDLWSLFDFINPGLLGSAKDFTAFTKRLTNDAGRSFGPLRELVRPYILRRLKTDKSVIADLPDKTEIKTYCSLNRKQAALYEQAVRDLAAQIGEATGIRRKGLVLSYLMRFKQICNHPAQWLGDGSWLKEESGKLTRLREIAETIAAKQEKMLVFTQFRETTAPLAAFLETIFERPGLVLHGETEVKKRKDLVRRFQEDDACGFFVLSLKAGGSGLNLTAASHVVHFDRWWNPAVENQATDRAFRIGQTRNVLVHKFVCRGTVEEKIDELIESKRSLAEDVLEGDGGAMLTEMKDDELLKLVALDLSKAIEENG